MNKNLCVNDEIWLNWSIMRNGQITFLVLINEQSSSTQFFGFLVANNRKFLKDADDALGFDEGWTEGLTNVYL